MTPDEFPRSETDRIEQQAAMWMIRCDRGLTAGEQDDYLQWRRKDPRHAPAMARQEATLRRLAQLRAWQPQQGTEPNPDLFAPPGRRLRWLVPVSLAAAAMLMAGSYLGWRAWSRTLLTPSKNYLVVDERVALPDGSVVELRDGTHLEMKFTPGERRVRLSGLEALFTVAKNPARPFIVEAGSVAVRAVGTAFDVRLDAASVEVLVTEGKVRMDGSPGNPAQPLARSSYVVAGERADVSLSSTAAPHVTRLTPAEISEALDWQKPRLQFYETPLADAVAEFNRHNRRQISLGEADLAAQPIGGTFQVDDVDGFSHILEITLGLKAEARGPDRVVLTRGR